MSTSVLSSPLIADSIVDLIGRTPIVRLGRLAKESNVNANILLKLESMEPCSSVKDRLAKGLYLIYITAIISFLFALALFIN